MIKGSEVRSPVPPLNCCCVLGQDTLPTGKLGGSHWAIPKLVQNVPRTRKYFVSVGNFTPELIEITCGVPQVYMLGPLLFNICTLPLAKGIKDNNIIDLSNVDETQIYITKHQETNTLLLVNA